MPFNVFSGARAKFLLKETLIGYSAGVSGEEAIDYEPIDTLDFLQVREHVPVAYRSSLSAAFFRLVGSPLKKYGSENVEIFPLFNNILTSAAMTASIQDNSGVTIALFTEVRAASKTFDVSARGVVAENCSFVAIRQLDEAENDV